MVKAKLLKLIKQGESQMVSLRQANKDLRDLLQKELISQIGKRRNVRYTMHD